MTALRLVAIFAAGLWCWTALSQTDLSQDAQTTLAESCFGCHGEKVQMGGLRLDQRSSAIAKAIIPGRASDSPLTRRIPGAPGVARMPMGSAPLPAEKIALLTKWIDAGATWPAGTATLKQHWA